MEKENLKTLNTNMGLGELANGEIFFVRQFRFLLNGDHLSDAFNLSVDFDWTEKNN